MLDKANWAEKGENAAPLAVHTVFCLTNSEDSISRDDAISIRDIRGGMAPNESQTFLVWLVDTGAFRIYLPQDKSLQWRKDIYKILHQGKVDS